VTVPIGDRDVVRAAFVWNLAVESRLGAARRWSRRLQALADLAGGRRAIRCRGGVTPPTGWPSCTGGARSAVARSDSADGGLLLVCVPPAWLRRRKWARCCAGSCFRLDGAPDLLETYSLAGGCWRRATGAESASIHGAAGCGGAERVPAPRRRRRAHLGRDLASYGLLVDDLHIYRAIVSRRPIGLEHPQSRAARALRDVARLLLEDARKMALA
jgi:hypothetical protein